MNSFLIDVPQRPVWPARCDTCDVERRGPRVSSIRLEKNERATSKLGGAAAIREKLFPTAIGIFLGSAFANGCVVLWNLWLFYYYPSVPPVSAVY